jgi:AICAR transformylase/IMP cyclohydrolase PurH
VGASDSFFPKSDGPTILCDNGVTVMFATSGSIADKEIAGVFADAGVTFVTISDKIGRGFCAH